MHIAVEDKNITATTLLLPVTFQKSSIANWQNVNHSRELTGASALMKIKISFYILKGHQRILYSLS